MRRYRGASLLAAALLHCAAMAGEERPAARPAPGALQERAHVQLRSVRLRIQPTPAARPGECLELGADDLEVKLGGEPLPRAGRIELERRREPTLHALLVDTSGSMADRLDLIRRAADDYVDRLSPEREKALLVSFDESPILLSRPTRSFERLHGAVEAIRPGVMTALIDGLYDVILELDAHRERPVIVLITDGVDSSSRHERAEINALVEARPDLTVFVVAIKLPPLVSGPPGLLSTRRFLQRLARRTNGSFIEDMTGSRLAHDFDRIRELLENEAVLSFVDPDPEHTGRKVSLRSRRAACRVREFRTPPPHPLAPRLRPIPRAAHAPPSELELFPARADLRYYELDGRGAVDPDCARGVLAGKPWFVELDARGLTGCSLDVTMDTGLLFSTLESDRVAPNAYLMQKTRPFRVPLAPPTELPRRPEQLMDGLAELALSLADAKIELDWRKLPADRHARPYHDVPLVVNGQTFLEIRPRLAHAQFEREDYRDWVLGRLRAEARGELDALKARFARLVPGRSELELEQAVQLSREGTAIRLRAESPSEVDLQGYLAAWLGDIPAAELFGRWEVERANRWLGDPRPESSFAALRSPWSAVRALFFVPSYTRTLTLLAPVHDPELDRIGYWRVVLPRPGWVRLRIQATRRSPEWYQVPNDLVPDLPLGFWLIDRLDRERTGLVEHVRRAGYRVVDVDYELLAKPYRQDPRRAYRNARVRLALERPGARLLLTADLGIDAAAAAPRLGRLRLEVAGDVALERLAETTALRFSEVARLD